MSIRRITLLLLLFGLLAACAGSENDKIKVAAVERAPVAEVVEAAAKVAARATATLRSPAEGTVAKLYVTDGDKVRKGQVLAKIDSPAAREQLRQARRALAQSSGGGGLRGVDLSALTNQSDRNAARTFAAARKAAKRIRDQRARARVLAAIAGAEAEYAASRAAAQGISSQINAGLGSIARTMAALTAASRTQAAAAVRAAERTVEALTIKAPFGGVAALGGPGGGANLPGILGQLPPQLAGQLGQVTGGAAGVSSAAAGAGQPAQSGGGIAIGVPVSAGDGIVTVTDTSTLSLIAEVDETDVLLVKKGIKATAELDAVPGGTYQATVRGVGVTPQESTGGGVSYRVRLALGKGAYTDGTAAPTPRPGMSAVLRLTVREVADAVAVPAAAVVTSGRDSVVWVVRDGRAQRRVVKLGAQGEALVQVVSGLNQGERIVVRGADSVRPGQRLP